MASGQQKASALLKLLKLMESQPELPGIPTRPVEKSLIPAQPDGTAASARTPITKTDASGNPDEFNTLSDNELLGISDPRYNEYQKAFIEESRKQVEPDLGPVRSGNVHGDRKLTGDEEVVDQQKGDVISVDQQQHGNVFSLQELLDTELSLSQRSRAGERGLAPTIHKDYTKRVRSTGGPSERAKQRANSPTYKDEDGVERYKFASKGHQEAAKNAKKEFTDDSTLESTDFEGQAMDEELQKIGDILAKETVNDPSALREIARPHAREALAGENVNKYIQDIGTRFEDMFMNEPFKANQGTKEFPVKHARKQGSFGSIIRDKWNAYDKFARIARDDRFPKEKRQEAVREIIEIDKWLANQDIQPSGQNELLNDLGRYSQPAVPLKTNTLKLKQGNKDDLGPIARTLANRTKQQSGFDPSQLSGPPGISEQPARMSLEDLIKFMQQGK
jgi:hypothetical protein